MSQKVDLARTVQVNRREMVKLGIVIVIAALAAAFVLGAIAAVVVGVLAGVAFEFRPGIARWTRRKWYEFRAREDRDIINAPVAPRAQPAAAAQVPQQRPAPAGPAPRRAPPPPPRAQRGAGRKAASGPAAQSGGVPPIWAALADSIREFVPENHVEHLDSFSGHAAGILAVAEAFRDNADMQFHHLGLDPAAANATLEFADHFAECAESLGLTREQFLVIYQEVLNAIDNGLVLPHSGRWLTGEAA